MKLIRLAVVVVGLLSATAAFAADAREGLISIQLTNGTADLYYPSGGGYISAADHSEIGLAIQYWRLMSKDYAFTFSAGMGTFSETDKPGTGSTPGDPDHKYSQDSWNFRIGGDRAVKVGDRAIFYFGPGVEYWSGKAKFEGFGGAFATDPYETESATRYALSGRVGGVMLLSEKLGINCEVGRYIGYASADESGAKATWWPSGFQAAGGLVIRL